MSSVSIEELGLRKECRDLGVRLNSQLGDERGVVDEIAAYVLSASLKSDDFYVIHEAMFICSPCKYREARTVKQKDYHKPSILAAAQSAKRPWLPIKGNEAMLFGKDWAVGAVTGEKKPGRSHLRVLKSPP